MASESIAEIVNRTFGEPVNVLDELRIVAEDANLSRTERDVLVRAADELDQAQRMLCVLNDQCAQLRAYCGAMQERMTEKLKAPGLFGQTSGRVVITGWGRR